MFFLWWGITPIIKKAFIFADHFVRVEIKVPINMPRRMKDLREQISLEFDVQQAGEKTTSSMQVGSLKD